jgi:hypothetical protein
MNEGLMAQLRLNTYRKGVSVRGKDPMVAFGNLLADIHEKADQLQLSSTSTTPL